MNTYLAAGVLILSGAFLGLARAQADIPQPEAEHMIKVDDQMVRGNRFAFLHVPAAQVAFVKTVEVGNGGQKPARYHFDTCQVEYSDFAKKFPNPDLDKYLDSALAECSRINHTEFSEDDEDLKQLVAGMVQAESERQIERSFVKNSKSNANVKYWVANISGVIGMGLGGGLAYKLFEHRDMKGLPKELSKMGTVGVIAMLLNTSAYTFTDLYFSYKQKHAKRTSQVDTSLADNDVNLTIPLEIPRNLRPALVVQGITKAFDTATRQVYQMAKISNGSSQPDKASEGAGVPAF